eukprot:321423_1
MGCNMSKNEPGENRGKGNSFHTLFSTSNSQVVQLEQQQQQQQEQTFDHSYKLKGELGSGKYSTIREAVNIKTGVTYAVKCVKRAALPEEAEIALQSEIQILNLVDHPNIVNLHEVYTDPYFTYLVMEYVPGGELFDGIVSKKYFPEAECRSVMHQLLSGMAYLHNHNIIHRGLKPEKLLLSASPRVLKISGFNDACFDTAQINSGGGANDENIDSMSIDSMTPPCSSTLKLKTVIEHKTVLGTRGYASPEMLIGLPYGSKVDVWSAGIIMYMLLCGYPPFTGNDHNVLEQRIKSGYVAFHPKYWSRISADAKNLVSAMLVVDADNRISSKDALNHPWFSS